MWIFLTLCIQFRHPVRGHLCLHNKNHPNLFFQVCSLDLANFFCRECNNHQAQVLFFQNKNSL